MPNNLQLGSLTINNLTQRTISLIGGKGTGKTSLLKMLCKASDVPTYIFDPLNVIRIKGFDVIKFNRAMCDNGANAGKFFNAPQKNPHIIFSLVDMLQSEQATFINGFFVEWKPNGVLIAIDEIQDFVPQNQIGGTYCFELERAIKHWRNRDCGFIIDSQRPAYVNKNVLALTDFMVLFRVTYPNDVKAVEEILTNMLTKEEVESIISKLQTKEFLSGYSVDFRQNEKH